MPIRKRTAKQNLHDLDVLINDTTPNSDYFNVSEIPEVLPGGKSFFRIAGSSLLILNTEILIEVLDSNGNVIYVEYPDYVDEGGRRLVVFYVYPETPAGDAILTIVGEAAYMPDGSEIPAEWQEIYNVKWERKLNVDPTKVNAFSILLERVPVVVVEEAREAYREALYLEGATAEITGSIAGTYDADNDRQVLVSTTPIFNQNHIGGKIVVASPQGVTPSTDNVELYRATIIGVENAYRAYAYPPYMTSETVRTG